MSGDDFWAGVLTSDIFNRQREIMNETLERFTARRRRAQGTRTPDEEISELSALLAATARSRNFLSCQVEGLFAREAAFRDAVRRRDLRIFDDTDEANRARGKIFIEAFRRRATELEAEGFAVGDPMELLRWGNQPWYDAFVQLGLIAVSSPTI